MKRLLITGFLTLLTTAAWAQGALPQADAEVRRVDTRANTVTLRHGDIKNLDMPPMTMVFQVKDTAWLQQIKAGDKVRFTADKVGVATLDGAWPHTPGMGWCSQPSASSSGASEPSHNRHSPPASLASGARISVALVAPPLASRPCKRSSNQRDTSGHGPAPSLSASTVCMAGGAARRLCDHTRTNCRRAVMAMPSLPQPFTMTRRAASRASPCS